MLFSHLKSFDGPISLHKVRYVCNLSLVVLICFFVMPFQYYILYITSMLLFPSELDDPGDLLVNCKFTMVKHI